MNDIRSILLDLGYTLSEGPKEFRTRPIYRESGNNTSLRIDKETGRWKDFSLCVGGTFEELVALTLNLKNTDEVKSFLRDKYSFNFKAIKARPSIKTIKTYTPDILANLIPQHDYWINRGISLDTLRLFRGGVALRGGMANRYVFPIFNSQKLIIGFTGRTLVDSENKWKHRGPKSEWKYPLFLNYDIILQRKEVILVESVGDALALWEAGVKNFMVIFGVEVSNGVMNTLLKMNLNKIIIALNNEPDNNSIGNKAAEKAQMQLKKHFDYDQIEIRLPTLKDINKMWIDDRNSVAQLYGK